MAIIHFKASNKTQTPVKTTAEGNVSVTEPVSVHSGYIPFIDKISITVKLPSSDVAAIYADVEQALLVKGIFQWAKPSPRFKNARLISCSGTSERVLFHFGSKEPTSPDCRLEFNPAKVGHDGLLGLDCVLQELFPDGWSYVTKHGGVSRIDVAVDIPGIRMDEFLFLESQGLTQRRIGRSGHLQTLYAGLPHGNQTRIYSKSGEMKAKGTPLSHSVVRVECITRNPHLKVHDLVKLPNPF